MQSCPWERLWLRRAASGLALESHFGEFADCLPQYSSTPLSLVEDLFGDLATLVALPG